ncbi:MAG: hypothetical protein KKE44_02775 [Proteobacteria bacterium]|nr:hypothetical protein [Pseudomonadota bacterium]MBU1581650.1 hypothetical protein [Pseudomonadota bacterium]MBU2451798.1 hypothetical protein [Pseudomonadota bacterium]MBU2629310.1 hypothetical protein [Pseudomonadota bacterium]
MNDVTMKNITEEWIQRLKNNVLFLQKKAVNANLNEDQMACDDALKKQGLEIEALIKLTETYNRQLGETGQLSAKDAEKLASWKFGNEPK